MTLHSAVRSVLARQDVGSNHLSN